MKKGRARIWMMAAFLSFIFMGPLPLCADEPIPKLIKIGVNEIGTGGHLQASLVAEAIIEKYRSLALRAIPAGVGTARNLMARVGDVDFTMASPADDAYILQEGLLEYSLPEWGPQPIRGLWFPAHPGVAFAVRGTSDIRSVADLKGRTVARFPGKPNTDWRNEAQLSFANLTWNDVKGMDFASPNAGYKAVIDGKVDSCFFNVTASKSYELAASPWGIRYLPMPASDQAGWQRVRSKCPPLSPMLATIGAGLSEKDPVWIVTLAYPITIAWERTDEAKVYFLTKAIHQTYGLYSQKDKSLKTYWPIERHWALWEKDTTPLHRGAVRYFQEIGQWSPERQKMNQERLEHQAQVKALWDATVEEALKQKMKSDKFPDFWLKKRTAAGLPAPKLK